MAVNLEQLRHAADIYHDATAKKNASDRDRQEGQDDVSRASVRELHVGLDTYFNTLWEAFGAKEKDGMPRVLVQFDRPRQQERAAPYVATFLRTTMGVDKQSPLTVAVEKNVLSRTMELSLGNIGVRIETSATWFTRNSWVEVTVFDVYGRLERQKDIRVRDTLVKAFDGGAKDKLASAQQLFAFVVERTTDHLKNEAKRIEEETK